MLENFFVAAARNSFLAFRRRPRYTPRVITARQAARLVVERIVMKDLEVKDLTLIEGYLLCLWNSDAVRAQSSQWKRRLLFFMSGVCVEIAALPYLSRWIGYDSPWTMWLLTLAFLPLGILGFYASKLGSDRLVEFLLVAPKLGPRT
jgi:hypothetical protein